MAGLVGRQQDRQLQLRSGTDLAGKRQLQLLVETKVLGGRPWWKWATAGNSQFSLVPRPVRLQCEIWVFLADTWEFLVPAPMTWLWNDSLVSNALFLLGALICFWICLINSFHFFGFNFWMFLLLFTTGNCPFRVVVADLADSTIVSWLKSAPPGINPSSRQQKKIQKEIVNDLVHLAVRPANVWSSCIALLSLEVRWSEVEWHVSFVWTSQLSVRCEMNGNGLFYTSIIEMNVVCELLLPWAHCYFVEGTEWPACFTCCLAFFVLLPLCSQMTLSFVFVAFVSRRYILVWSRAMLEQFSSVCYTWLYFLSLTTWE